MSSFIKDYLNHLKKSDEHTKDRSALFLSFIATLIAMSILFLVFKDNIFVSTSNKNIQDKNIATQNLEDSNTANDVVSPFTSLTKFIKDSGEQFSKIKTDISSTFSSSSAASTIKN
jgi:hypothetical protein